MTISLSAQVKSANNREVFMFNMTYFHPVLHLIFTPHYDSIV